MQKYFIRHKLSVGDTAFLSDSDSEIAISKNLLKLEDPIKIETLDNIFLGQVVNIKPSSIEVEIVKNLGKRQSILKPSITIIQSLSNKSKFDYFIEKSVEIGVGKIIPIESDYSLRDTKQALKDFNFWNKIIKNATEQSRNIFPTDIEEPSKIKSLLKRDFSEYVKICLATENVETKNLTDILKSNSMDKPFIISIGPEKGWSSSDIDIFKQLNFDFVSLEGNILRTETTSLVITSIIKYLKGEI